jgi:hypothetical protein
MLVPYLPEESRPYYQKYYNDQVGHGMGVFEGDTIQTGRGIGSVVSSLFKSTLPLLKSGVKVAGRELLKTGANIASEALKGRDLRESATENFKEAGSNLLDSLASSLSSPKHISRPKKRRSRRKRSNSPNLFHKVRVI